MNWNDALQLTLKFLAIMGGVGVVSAAVAAWISKHMSDRWLQTHKAELDRELETHKAELVRETEARKLSLRRQELMFQRELEATDAFMMLWRAIWPKYETPDMDYDDAISEVAGKLDAVEKEIDKYLVQHSSVISSVALQKLEGARTEASHAKFYSEHEPGGPAPKAADKVLTALLEVKEQLLADLRR